MEAIETRNTLMFFPNRAEDRYCSIRFLTMNIASNMKPLKHESDPDGGRTFSCNRLQEEIYKLVGRSHKPEVSEENQKVLGEYITWIKRPEYEFNLLYKYREEAYYYKERTLFKIEALEDGNIKITYLGEDVDFKPSITLEVSRKDSSHDYFTGKFILSEK